MSEKENLITPLICAAETTGRKDLALNLRLMDVIGSLSSEDNKSDEMLLDILDVAAKAFAGQLSSHVKEKTKKREEADDEQQT